MNEDILRRAGSSPLARGLRHSGRVRRRIRRIIPARAGFTFRVGGANAGYEDHPRSRGVYVHGKTHSTSPVGSSPLARGLLIRVEVEHGQPGIIPARAGFTSGGFGSWGRPWDHPRSRGVYPPACLWPTSHQGSSPLARGLPCITTRSFRRLGIIPARAGFTPRAREDHSCAPDHPRSRGVYAVPPLRHH
mgnify:CR=1 FL=1